MTPAARLAAVVELLVLIDEGTAPAEQQVTGYFRTRRYAGSKDRRWVSDFVYRVLRRRGELDWAAKQVGGTGSARMRAILSLILFDGLSLEEMVLQYFGGTHGLPLPKEEEIRQFAAVTRLDMAAMPVADAGNFPDWIADALVRQYGQRATLIMDACRERGPVTFRVNRQKAKRGDILEILTGEGFDVRPTGLAPDGIILETRANLTRHPLFERGLIEPQDEAAQIAARLACAQPGMNIVDFCAGGGGKSLAMAADMNYEGKIHAFDTSERRLRDIVKRAGRAGVKLIEEHVLAPSGEADPVLEALEGAADRVFVDAPCSGSGTWRRQPDQKWRLTPERLGELILLQREILERAAPLVKPGGYLIYATCSILAAENEAQVDAFLSAHPGFTLCPVRSLWEEAGLTGNYDEDCLALTPADTGSDGFFTAVLERLPVSA